MKEAPPVIHRTWKRRIQVEQGVYEIARKPSLYGWVRKKVALGREWHEIPAVYKTVRIAERTRNGIPIPSELRAALDKMAEELGIAGLFQ